MGGLNGFNNGVGGGAAGSNLLSGITQTDEYLRSRDQADEERTYQRGLRVREEADYNDNKQWQNEERTYTRGLRMRQDKAADSAQVEKEGSQLWTRGAQRMFMTEGKDMSGVEEAVNKTMFADGTKAVISPREGGYDINWHNPETGEAGTRSVSTSEMAQLVHGIAQDPVGVLAKVSEERKRQQALMDEQRKSERSLSDELQKIDRAGEWAIKKESTKGAGGEKAKPGVYQLSDGSLANIEQLQKTYKLEHNFPDDLQLMMMPAEQAAKIREQMAKAEPFTQWARKNYGVDVTGGGVYKGDSPYPDGTRVKVRGVPHVIQNGVPVPVGGAQSAATAATAPIQPAGRGLPAAPVVPPRDPLAGLRRREEIAAEQAANSPAGVQSRIQRDVAAAPVARQAGLVEMGRRVGMPDDMGAKDRGQAYNDMAAAMTRVNNDLKNTVVPAQQDLEQAFIFARGRGDKPSMEKFAELLNRFYPEAR